MAGAVSTFPAKINARYEPFGHRSVHGWTSLCSLSGIDGFIIQVLRSDRSVGKDVMRKGQLTREKILEKAAALFNCRGYSGTSLSEVMKVTGLEKGGIYNHFGSKDQLALEAFDYAVGVIGGRLQKSMEGKDSALDKLNAFLDEFAYCAINPPIPGGCPLLNTAVESDDAHPELRDRVKGAVGRLLGAISGLLLEGCKSGELRQDVNPEEQASLIVSALEGSIMLAKLYEDAERVRLVVQHLKEHITSLSA